MGYPFTVNVQDENGIHDNVMYPGSSKPKTPGMRQAPDTDPGMYISRAVSTAPQAAVGGAKNLIWDLIGLPMNVLQLGSTAASRLKDSDNVYLRALGLMGKDYADYLQGGIDLWDDWGENVDDALFGDRKVDDQRNIYRDGYNADGSMPVAQYVLKGLGSALNGPVAIAQAIRGYSPTQPLADIWKPTSPEVRRAMYNPTAKLDYSDPTGTYDAFVKEASKDPRVATMSLSRLGSDLLSDALALESLGTGVVKGAKLGAKATKAVAKDIKDGFTTDYSSRGVWGDPMTNALTGTTAVPKATMTNARFRDYNLRGR